MEPDSSSSLRTRLRHGLTRLSRLCQNPISELGLMIVGVSVALLLTFGLFTVLVPHTNPYVDILGLLVLPGILVLGLLIVPIGVWRRHRQLEVAARAGGRPAGLPRIDLNDPHTRSSLGIFIALTVFVMMPLLAVSTYQGYHYTDSVEFCGQVCHTVMEPQATAFADSPHARVACAECHIGSGAGWFVKSKLSGTRQVFAVLGNTYPRPIPPAITELRPARETCEECHWPKKFFGSQYKEIVRFSPDELNTRRVVRMLLKTGGADQSIGRVEGIHAHMLLSARVEYVATDDRLQEIPWVRYTSENGPAQVYRSDGLPADAPPPGGILRTVDCMDCHNRGAHHFRAPQDALDLWLNVDRIDDSLPFIKREAAAVLVGGYPDVVTAETAIEEALGAFYATNYPQLWATRRAEVDRAIAAVQDVYRRNFFPAMNVTWQTYPENIGHLNSPGCFRCHDGRHFDAAGQPIRSECDLCHTFLNEVPGQPGTFVEGEFEHSMNLVKHGNLRCDQCHTGGTLARCRDCHASGEWLDEAGRDAFELTQPPQPQTQP